MLRKAMMLALAVGTLVALPSGAMADWTDGTVKVNEERTVNGKGTAKFSSGFLGAIECKTTTGELIEPGTTGKLQHFAVDGSATGCITGGSLAACQVHSLQPTSLPWVVHTNGTVVNITTGEIHISVTGGFCPGTSVTVTAGTPAMTPDNAHGSTQATLSGSLSVHVSGLGTGATTISGTQVVQAPDSGTYGIT